MYELAVYQAMQADRERQLAWVNKYGWMEAERRYERARKRRAAVARVLRALAARLAPADAGSVAELGPLAAESRG